MQFLILIFISLSSIIYCFELLKNYLVELTFKFMLWPESMISEVVVNCTLKHCNVWDFLRLNKLFWCCRWESVCNVFLLACTFEQSELAGFEFVVDSRIREFNHNLTSGYCCRYQGLWVILFLFILWLQYYSNIMRHFPKASVLLLSCKWPDLPRLNLCCFTKPLSIILFIYLFF